MTANNTESSLIKNIRLGGAVIGVLATSLTLFSRLLPMLLDAPHTSYVVGAAAGTTIMFLLTAHLMNKAWYGLLGAIATALIISLTFVLFANYVSVDGTKESESYDPYDPPRR